MLHRNVSTTEYAQLSFGKGAGMDEAVTLTERPAHASWTQLSTYSTCSLSYKLSYLDRYPKTPQGALIGGSAVHKAIEFAEPERLWEDEKIAWAATEGLRIFEEEVEKAGGEAAVRWSGRKDRDGIPNEGILWWRSQLPVMLKRYAMIRRNDVLNGMELVPGGSEMRVGVTLPSGRPLVVYIDAFFLADADGQFVVRDWKAAKVSRTVTKQPVIYAWAIREAKGWTCDHVELAYLKSGSGEVVSHPVAHLIDSVPLWFQKADLGIEAGVFAPEPNFFCEGCMVKAGCPHGRTLMEQS